MRVVIATVLCLASIPRCWTLTQAAKYQLIDVDDWPFTVVPLSVHAVKSVCAKICSSNSACTSFVTNCTATVRSEQFECRLSGSLDLTIVPNNGLLCLGLLVDPQFDLITPAVLLLPTTTTDATASAATTAAVAATTGIGPPLITPAVLLLPTTTTDATTSLGPTQPSVVIDIVYGVRDLCYVGSSNDILALTDVGVYVYDSDITTSPCSGPLEMSDVFPGYTDLPDITNVKAIVLYQTSILELYTADDVYRWMVSGGNTPLLHNGYTVQNIASFLGLPLGTSTSFNWGCYRTYSSWERQYATEGGRFMVQTDSGYQLYDQSDVVPGMNGYNLNPWESIPSDTVALTGYGSQYSTDFLLVNSALEVFEYTLTYAGMTVTQIDMTPRGTMIFV